MNIEILLSGLFDFFCEMNFFAKVSFIATGILFVLHLLMLTHNVICMIINHIEKKCIKIFSIDDLEGLFHLDFGLWILTLLLSIVPFITNEIV